MRTMRHELMPQTLGDKLDETMTARNHTTEVAAQIIGVSPTDLLAWINDARQPDRTHHTSLASYLGIDEQELRGLVLRSQMRRAQARIRN